MRTALLLLLAPHLRAPSSRAESGNTLAIAPGGRLARILSQVFCKTSIVAVAVAVDVVVDVDVDVDVTDDVAVEVADALAVDVDVDVEVCDDEDVAVAVDVAVVVEVPVDVDVDDAVDDDVDVDVAVDVDVSEDVAVFVCARSSHIAASPASHPKSLPFSGRKPSVQRPHFSSRRDPPEAR
jgi:hypothetical protein